MGPVLRGPVGQKGGLTLNPPPYMVSLTWAGLPPDRDQTMEAAMKRYLEALEAWRAEWKAALDAMPTRSSTLKAAGARLDEAAAAVRALGGDPLEGR